MACFVCLRVSARTAEVMREFGRLYEQQYAVALFNNVRFDVEGGGGPQPQLLHRKVKYPVLPVWNHILFFFRNCQTVSLFTFSQSVFRLTFWGCPVHTRLLSRTQWVSTITTFPVIFAAVLNHFTDVKFRISIFIKINDNGIATLLEFGLFNEMTHLTLANAVNSWKYMKVLQKVEISFGWRS